MIRALTGLAAVVIASLTVGFAQQPNSDWANYGLDYYEQRFSPLDQINDRNAGQLGLAWQFETATDRGLEATPLVIDGVMYTTGSWSVTYAIDARTGKQMWKYDPEVHRKYDNLACCDVVNRGAAFYKGKVYVGVLDGRLVALDMKTGKPAWSAVTVDQSQPFTITGPPRVFDGKVVIGNAGGDYGVRAFVVAYDAESGKKLWKFYTVPGDPSKGPDGEASDSVMAMAAEEGAPRELIALLVEKGFDPQKTHRRGD